MELSYFNAQQSIRVAIAEDHSMVLDMLVNEVNGYAGFKVIIQAANGQELINDIELAAIKPDICMVDIEMPVLNGYDTIPIIKHRWPCIKIIAVSLFKDEFAILSMLQKGANGYLTKGSGIKELEKALISIHNKGYYHSDLVPEQLFEDAKEIVLPKLTERERDYLSLCCSDLNAQQIADRMGISVRTIEHYRDSLAEKLHIYTRPGLVMFVKQTGIVAVPNTKDNS